MGLVDAEVGDAFVNSLLMAGGTAVFGTALVFVGAYLLEKTQGVAPVRTAVRLLAMLPMAVPGLVLGLGYIFFFNAAGQSAERPVPHAHAADAVHHRALLHHGPPHGGDGTQGAGRRSSKPCLASMKVPFYKTFWRVTLPICTPALVDIARYFFINAMTTISAVVFLYSPETKVAAIAILNLDEAGEIGAAAAMAVLIAAANALATGLFMGLSWWVDRRTQAWKTP
jgi:iron(III) transport system permease protein